MTISDTIDGQIVLETPRLLLRAARQEDAVFLHEAFSDPEVMRYWSSLPHQDLARSQSWISSMTDSPQNGITDFVICLREPSSSSSPVPIGKIGIYATPPSNEIGFLITRAHWHKGLAHEALSQMLEHLFNLKSPITTQPISSAALTHTKAEASPASPAENYTTLTQAETESEWQYLSITADTDPRNSASIGLLKKLGFAESGYVEHSMQIDGEGGEWVDSLYLRLERDVWVSTNRDRNGGSS